MHCSVFSVLIFVCLAQSCYPFLIPDENTKFVSSAWSTIPATHQKTDSKSDDIVDVLKALDLPSDFVNPKKKNEADPVQNSKINNFKPASRLPFALYMTGSPRLDKILNCPCKREQLDLLGVHGHLYTPPKYLATPNSQLASNPVTKSVKKIKVIKKTRLVGTAKGSKDSSTTTSGSIFGSAFRLLPDLPSLNFSFMDFLQPILSGFASTTLSQTLSKNMVGKKPFISPPKNGFPMSLSGDNNVNDHRNKIVQTKSDVGPPPQKINTFKKSHWTSSSNPWNPLTGTGTGTKNLSRQHNLPHTFASLVDSSVDLVTASSSFEFTTKKSTQSGSFAKSVSITMLVTSDDLPDAGNNKTLPIVQRNQDLKSQLREKIKNDIHNHQKSKTL